jgi:hypothetical protein
VYLQVHGGAVDENHVMHLQDFEPLRRGGKYARGVHYRQAVRGGGVG